MIKYKYIGFSKNTEVFKITSFLEEEAKEGWELVSHSYGPTGISVILKKDDGLTN